MISVLIQIWGPASAAPGSYNWISVGKIDNPESLDVDYLKAIISNSIKGNSVPNTDVLRLDVIIDGKSEMKMTLPDFFKNRKENTSN